MKIHNLTRDEVVGSLVTSEQGLAEREARKRLVENGFNEIRALRKVPLTARVVGTEYYEV